MEVSGTPQIETPVAQQIIIEVAADGRRRYAVNGLSRIEMLGLLAIAEKEIDAKLVEAERQQKSGIVQARAMVPGF